MRRPSRIGAEYGERSPERVTQRRVSVPGVGYPCRDVELHIPAQRGPYLPEPDGATARSERALLAVISRPTWKMYPEAGGIWSRPWGGEGISKSQVSRICQELDVVVDGFLGRPLDGDPTPTCGWTH